MQTETNTTKKNELKHYFLYQKEEIFSFKNEPGFTTGARNNNLDEMLKGNYIWLIGGKDKPRRFYLLKRIFVKRIAFRVDLKKWRGTGDEIYKEIEITQEKWWKNYNNKTFFHEIKDENLIAGLLNKIE